jgi:hypothetical protein
MCIGIDWGTKRREMLTLCSNLINSYALLKLMIFRIHSMFDSSTLSTGLAL